MPKIEVNQHNKYQVLHTSEGSNTSRVTLPSITFKGQASIVTLDYRIQVLVSYNEPVAFLNPNDGTLCRTEKFWSTTTSRHISAWIKSIEPADIQYVPQEAIYNLVKFYTKGEA